MPISLSALIDLCNSQAPLAVAALDAELRFLFVSRRWLDDYGMTESEVVGRCYSELFPHLQPQCEAALRRALAGQSERCPNVVWSGSSGRTQCADFELRAWRAQRQARAPRETDTSPADVGEAHGVVIFSERVIAAADGDKLSQLIEQRESLLRVEQKHSQRLEALRQSVLAISALDAHLGEHAVDLLQLILDQARALTGADYGALGVGTDPSLPFDPWVVSGLSQQQISQIGRTPRPVGLLGQLACEQRAIRVDDVMTAAPGVSLPANHPRLGPLLGVPILSNGHLLGSLYLARQPGAAAFVPEDHAIIELLAGHAAIAIENAKLFSKAHADVRAREEVLAVVSHDLTNPLNAIALREQQLSRASDPKVASHARSVARSVDEMRRMIHGLLDLTRLDSGKLVLDCKPTDVDALLHELVETLAPVATDREVSVRLEVDVPQPVTLDRDRMWQVLANLLGNALKFTPSGGEVCVRAHRADRVLAMSVLDTGVGIASEDLPYVFERYFTNGQGEQRNRGTGLGLYIAKGLVEAHGGTIAIESTRGTGTAVYIRLPIA